jgi:hypothetical protein
MTLHAFLQSYSQTLYIKNESVSPVSFNIKASAPNRYLITPPSTTLEGKATAAINITLRIATFPHRKKGELGQRDIIHVSSDFFDAKCFSTFYLVPPPPPTSPPKDNNNNNLKQEGNGGGKTRRSSYSGGTQVKVTSEDPSTAAPLSPTSRRRASSVTAGPSFRNMVHSEIVKKSDGPHMAGVLAGKSSPAASMKENMHRGASSGNIHSTEGNRKAFGVVENSDNDAEVDGSTPKDLLLKRVRKLEAINENFSQKINFLESKSDYFLRVDNMMKDRYPELPQLLEAAISQERKEFELKSEKVLNILLAKDRIIEDLEVELMDAQNESRYKDKEIKALHTTNLEREKELDDIRNQLVAAQSVNLDNAPWDMDLQSRSDGTLAYYLSIYHLYIYHPLYM